MRLPISQKGFTTFMQAERGFAPILIVVVIAIVALIGFVVIGSIDKSKEPPPFIKKLAEDIGRRPGGASDPEGHDEFSNLPECSGQQYSVALVDIDKIDSVTPLGNLNPPEHTN
ncbi:hypothetical protein IID21_05135, partial [Patescibacteria group bacterium]|nr:hypothetical protein [Patescibacteria group bacterium]